MIDKNAVPTKLLWLDLEMTGLNSQKDLILEVAAEVTDFNFQTLDSYEARISHDRNKLIELFNANPWYKDEFPQNRDDFLKTLDEAKPSEQVEKELREFLLNNFNSEPAVLAGNSIHNDRNFIKQYWPTFDEKLHYRMLDVSSWKIVMQAKYNVIYDKKEVHHAFDDIKASIAELKFYLDWLKNN